MATAPFLSDMLTSGCGEAGETMFADTLALAVQLADALHILTQCQARNVPLSAEFLAYVDDLTNEIEALQPSGMIPRA